MASQTPPRTPRTSQRRLAEGLADFAGQAAAVLVADGSGARLLFDRLADCNRDVYDFAIRNTDQLAAEAPEYRNAFDAMREALERTLVAARQCWAELATAQATAVEIAAENQDPHANGAVYDQPTDDASGCAEALESAAAVDLTGAQAVADAVSEQTIALETDQISAADPPGSETDPEAAVGLSTAFEPDQTAHPTDYTTELRSLREQLAEHLAKLPEITQGRMPEVPGTPRDDTAQLHWRRLHLDLLRVPDGARAEWYRENATGPVFAQAAGWDPNLRLIPPLPGEPDEPQGEKAEVASAGAGDPLDALARRARQAARLFEMDEELMLARPSALWFESRDEADHGNRVESALDFLVEQIAQADAGSPDGPDLKELATAAASFDALIGGLVHRRPAVRGSWWWTWREQSLAELAAVLKRFGCQVLGVQELEQGQRISKCTESNPSANAYKGNLVWVLQAAFAPADTEDKPLVKGQVVLGRGR